MMEWASLCKMREDDIGKYQQSSSFKLKENDIIRRLWSYPYCARTKVSHCVVEVAGPWDCTRCLKRAASLFRHLSTTRYQTFFSSSVLLYLPSLTVLLPLSRTISERPSSLYLCWYPGEIEWFYFIQFHMALPPADPTKYPEKYIAVRRPTEVTRAGLWSSQMWAHLPDQRGRHEEIGQRENMRVKCAWQPTASFFGEGEREGNNVTISWGHRTVWLLLVHASTRRSTVGFIGVNGEV